MPNITIYKIVNLIDGKVYIGQTKNRRKRWDEHKYELRKGIHHSIHLQRAWTKYGEENFHFQVLEECTRSESDDREIYWINALNTTNKMRGYNLEGGGGSCKTLAEETKKKIGEKNRVHYQRTKLFLNSESAIIKRSISNTGKKRSPEFRKRMTEIASNRTGEKNSFYGRAHSEETKNKIGAANSKPNPKRFKPLVATNENTGETIIFQSRKDAETHGFNRTGISNVLNGKWKTYKGFTLKER